MSHLALDRSDDFPIKHEGPVHSGKVRSVYWLTKGDSQRLIQQKAYDVHPDSQLGVMIITDNFSAFDSVWTAEQGLKGVPGKGAVLNEISRHWFSKLSQDRILDNHLLDAPHPLVWIVQKAEPIRVEAVYRQYITGSLWRSYSEKGAKELCGIKLPDGMKKNQKLDGIWYTPTTKGTFKGIPGIPEKEDAPVSPGQIEDNYQAFGFKQKEDVKRFENMFFDAFEYISEELEPVGYIFVDTKFEGGYVMGKDGTYRMIAIDEIGTPDSSRMWRLKNYKENPDNPVEESKEGGRQELLAWPVVPDKQLLKGYKDPEFEKTRVERLNAFAKDHPVPVNLFMGVSNTYARVHKNITKREPPKLYDARKEILDTLARYGILTA